MDPEIIIRTIEISDLPQVALIHILSFPASALSNLGTKIVQRYYLWQLTGPHPKVWAVGAFSADECVGFCFGGVYHHSVSGFVYLNKLCLVKEILLHPQLLIRLFFLKRIHLGVKMIRHFSKNQKTSGKNVVKEPKTASFGILSIGIAPSCQRLGIGKMLMCAAEEEAVGCGFEQMDLTVHPTNVQAVRFYEKNGWEKFEQDNAWKGVMIKKLKQKAIPATADFVNQQLSI